MTTLGRNRTKSRENKLKNKIEIQSLTGYQMQEYCLMTPTQLRCGDDGTGIYDRMPCEKINKGKGILEPVA